MTTLVWTKPVYLSSTGVTERSLTVRKGRMNWTVVCMIHKKNQPRVGCDVVIVIIKLNVCVCFDFIVVALFDIWYLRILYLHLLLLLTASLNLSEYEYCPGNCKLHQSYFGKNPDALTVLVQSSRRVKGEKQ